MSKIRDSVSETLSSLSMELLKTESEYRRAEYKLFYDQGQIIYLGCQLGDANTALVTGRGQTKLGSSLLNSIDGLEDLKSRVDRFVSSSAITASDVQLVSNAAAQMAAGMGAVSNMAMAADVQSDVFREAKHLAELTQKAAQNAMEMSHQAMEGVASAAEIAATKLSVDTSSLKKDVGALHASLASREESMLISCKEVSTSLAKATEAEINTTAVLQLAAAERIAFEATYANFNEQFNNGLVVKSAPAKGADRLIIDVSFTDYKQAFGDTDPAPDCRYFLLLVPRHKANLLDLEEAEILFSSHPPPVDEMDSAETTPFLAVTPCSKPRDYELTSAYPKCRLTDVDGAEFVKGESYCAFLYIEFDQATKQLRENFNDALSAPSQEFTMTQWAAQISNVEVRDLNRITFTATNIPADASVELRCLLLPSQDESFSQVDLKTAEEGTGFYFNKNIAEQINPANYLIAVHQGGDEFAAPLDLDSTDIFGNIIDDRTYRIAILATSGNENIASAFLIARCEAGHPRDFCLSTSELEE